MKKFLSLFFLVFLFSGCDSDSITEKFIVGLSSTLSTTLECAAPQEVEKDIRWLFGQSTEGVNFTSVEANGFNNQLCKIIATGIISVALDQGVPERWECKHDQAENNLNKLADMVCDRYANIVAEELK